MTLKQTDKITSNSYYSPFLAGLAFYAAKRPKNKAFSPRQTPVGHSPQKPLLLGTIVS